MSIITPKVKGFICITAHPDGCAANVDQQIALAKQTPLGEGPKKILIIGASTGYGLATRIAMAFGAKAQTLGVCFERPASEKRTASAGWYNTAALEKRAKESGLYAKTINGDAYSHAIKQEVCTRIREDLGQIDCLIYSLASPRRTDPDNGNVYQSVLKTVGQAFHEKTVDPIRAQLKTVDIEPASDEEIAQTVAVMGGDDWSRWVELLLSENLLADGFQTLHYSYIGPQLTYPIYKDGTIGHAKADVEQHAATLQEKLAVIDGSACVSVNKAVVTQASAAIPVVPLYLSVLFKIMKEKNIHEDCIEQMIRLLKDYLYTDQPKPRDDKNRIRLDDLELRDDVQVAVRQMWDRLTQDNLISETDITGYQQSFYQLFGFKCPSVDYEKDVDPQVDAMTD